MKPKTVHMIDVPAKQIPPFRYHIGKEAGIKQILITTYGGIGDQVCAEPTLRHCLKLFKDYKVSLLTSFPALFEHLSFERVYSQEEAYKLDDSEWIVIHTNGDNTVMLRDFVNHHFMNLVDFSSIAALQRQLPIAERSIHLTDTIEGVNCAPRIVIHPGKTWASRTFPKFWWDEVIDGISELTEDAAIVGRSMYHAGTVDVAVPFNVKDLRGKLSLKQLAGVLKRAEVVVTNDSSPIHIASTGCAHIIFIATVRHPDHLKHYRSHGDGEFGWRMHNLGLDGAWNWQNLSPIRTEPLDMTNLPSGLTMERILPSPQVVIDAAEQYMNSF